MNAKLNIVGHGRAVIRDEAGRVKELREFDNVFTDVGDAQLQIRWLLLQVKPLYLICLLVR